MHREDYLYLAPEADDAEGECVYETGGDDTCDAPATDLFCDVHDDAISPEDRALYERHHLAA